MNNLEVNGLSGLEKLNADLLFGLPKESPIIRTLSEYFQEEIEKSAYQYCPYDASSKTTKYEIKSRRNKYLQYPTTIIPVDKTERIKGDRLVFVFNFTDGLYYIEYSKEAFAKYEIKDIEAVRKGGVRTWKPHYHINIKDLKQINV